MLHASIPMYLPVIYSSQATRRSRSASSFRIGVDGAWTSQLEIIDLVHNRIDYRNFGPRSAVRHANTQPEDATADRKSSEVSSSMFAMWDKREEDWEKEEPCEDGG